MLTLGSEVISAIQSSLYYTGNHRLISEWAALAIIYEPLPVLSKLIKGSATEIGWAVLTDECRHREACGRQCAVRALCLVLVENASSAVEVKLSAKIIQYLIVAVEFADFPRRAKLLCSLLHQKQSRLLPPQEKHLNSL